MLTEQVNKLEPSPDLMLTEQVGRLEPDLGSRLTGMLCDLKPDLELTREFCRQELDLRLRQSFERVLS